MKRSYFPLALIYFSKSSHLFCIGNKMLFATWRVKNFLMLEQTPLTHTANARTYSGFKIAYISIWLSGMRLDLLLSK